MELVIEHEFLTGLDISFREQCDIRVTSNPYEFAVAIFSGFIRVYMVAELALHSEHTAVDHDALRDIEEERVIFRVV